jgi:hypothetical protein
VLRQVSLNRLCFIICALIIWGWPAVLDAAPVIHPPAENATPGGDPATQNKPRYTWVQAEPGKPNQAAFPPGCKAPQQPDHLIFRDLKSVNLLVRVMPGKYLYAEKCLGREKECLNNNGALKAIPELSPVDLTLMSVDYRMLRKPLLRDKLLAAFSKVLKMKLMPFVIPANDCKVPDPVILDDRGSDSGRNAIEHDPATLTVAVTLRLVDTTKPPIAVLTLNYYRPDPTHSSFIEQVPDDVTAIPLDLPDDQISVLLDQFANGLSFSEATHSAN